MKRLVRVVARLAAGAAVCIAMAVESVEMSVYTDPDRTDTDFRFQGDYASTSARLDAQIASEGLATPNTARFFRGRYRQFCRLSCLALHG